MNYTVLKSLIAEQSGTNAEVAAWCNTPSITVTRERFVTTRTLMAELGPVMADAILTKLEAAAAQSPLINRTLLMLRPSEGGIDVALPAVVGQLNALVSDFLTQAEADSVSALAQQLVSPAKNAGLPIITEGDIQFARTQ
jgi:hypothetical protein